MLTAPHLEMKMELTSFNLDHLTEFEKKAFIQGLLRTGGRAIPTISKGFQAPFKAVQHAKRNVGQFTQNVRTRVNAARRYARKNIRAGARGDMKSNYPYQQALKSEQNILAQQAKALKAKALKTEKALTRTEQKTQRKMMKRQGTAIAQKKAVKPLPNQRSKMVREINRNINARGGVPTAPNVKKAPSKHALNRIKTSPISAQAIAKRNTQNNADWLARGREAWGKLTPMQQNIAKGGAGGVALIGGANVLSGNGQQQYPQQYPRYS